MLQFHFLADNWVYVKIFEAMDPAYVQADGVSATM